MIFPQEQINLRQDQSLQFTDEVKINAKFYSQK